MDGTKYEFAGPEWRAFMHGLISERLSKMEQAKMIDWSFCEVFTNAPDHLRSDGQNAVWHCIVRNGTASFGSTELADATMKITADYEAILPLARFDTLGDPERALELQTQSKTLMESGRMTISGDPSKLDPRLGSLHDPIAKVTA